MKTRLTKTLAVILVFTSSYALFISPAAAQNFSGSDPCNYTCPKLVDSSVTPHGSVQACKDIPHHLTAENVWLEIGQETGGVNFVCWYSVTTKDAAGVTHISVSKRNASPLPPTLVQVEVWAVRLLYIAWALAGIYFTIVLMYIGFMYLTSFGNDTATKDVIVKFRHWIIGFVLVFLSYPILNTFFSILPLNTDITCYQDVTASLPAFQLVFPNICTTTLSTTIGTHP